MSDAFAPREPPLLELDGLPRRALGAREVPQQRGDVRELKRVPASLRIQGEGPLEGLHRVREPAGADEMGARQRRVRRGVVRVELERPANRLEPLVLAAEVHERGPELLPRAREARLEREALFEARHGLLEQLRHREIRRLHLVRFAEREPRAGIERVQGHGALEEEDRPVDGLPALGPEVDEALGIRLVRVDHVRFLGLPRRRDSTRGAGPRRAPRRRGPAGRRDRSRLPSTFTVVTTSPDSTSVTRAVIRMTSPTPWKPPVTTRRAPTSRPSRIASSLAPRDVSPVSRFSTSHTRSQPITARPGDVLQVGGDGLHDPGAEPVVLGVLRDVREREDGDRVLGRGGGDRRRARPRRAARQSRELTRDVAHRRAALAILREHLQDEGLQLPRNGRIEPRQRRRLRVEQRVDDGDRVRAFERPPAGEKLPEQHAQREDVRARVDVAAQGLLGRHVRDGPEHGTRRRARRVRADRAPGLAPVARHGPERREAEVEDLHAPPSVHHDVAGLDVAVDDPARMRGRERVGDLQDDVHGLGDLRRALLEKRRQRAPRDVLHRDEALPPPLALHRVDVVDDGDVRVVELRGESRLAQEAALLILRAAQHLQGDGPPQLEVLGAKDLSHPAFTEPLRDAVVREDFPDHGGILVRRRRPPPAHNRARWREGTART